MEDGSAEGDVFSGVCVYRAWGLSACRGHQSYSDGIQLLTGALWLWQVQTHPHLQSGPEVSIYSWLSHTHTRNYFVRRSESMSVWSHFLCCVSGGDLRSGITKHSDTFAPPKPLVFAIPSSRSKQRVQKQKFEPCYHSGTQFCDSECHENFLQLFALLHNGQSCLVWEINSNGNVVNLPVYL